MGHLAAAVANRRDRRQLPEQLAVLAPVVEFAAPDLAGADRLPQVLVFLPRHVPGLQNPRTFSDHLGVGVAGRLGELGVDVFDAAFDIGDHHRNGALLHRLEQLAEVALGALVGGDVLDEQQEDVLAAPPHRDRPHLAVGDAAARADDLDLGDVALHQRKAEGGTDQLPGGMAEQALRRPVDKADIVPRIDDDDALRVGFDDRAPPGLALFQRVVRFLPLGHVFGKGDDLSRGQLVDIVLAPGRVRFISIGGSRHVLRRSRPRHAPQRLQQPALAQRRKCVGEGVADHLLPGNALDALGSRVEAGDDEVVAVGGGAYDEGAAADVAEEMAEAVIPLAAAADHRIADGEEHQGADTDERQRDHRSQRRRVDEGAAEGIEVTARDDTQAKEGNGGEGGEGAGTILVADEHGPLFAGERLPHRGLAIRADRRRLGHFDVRQPGVIDVSHPLAIEAADRKGAVCAQHPVDAVRFFEWRRRCVLLQ